MGLILSAKTSEASSAGTTGATLAAPVPAKKDEGMPLSDWSAIAVLLALLLHCAYRAFRRHPIRETLHEAAPAAVGCVIAACAARSGHPVLAAMMGVATLVNILYVVRPAAMRGSAPVGRHER